MNNSIRVGILHSLVGSLATGEIPVKDATLMAIDEINQAGGILGNRIEPAIADGASDPMIFQREARRLLQEAQVVTLFGCWSSACRKQVIPVLEAFNGLLWYPVQYEGLECSKHVFYTGACANQQLEPAVHWLLHHHWKRIYLIGSDYVFPRVANKIVRSYLQAGGGEVVREVYHSLDATDFQASIAEIQQLRPDAVFNTLNGDSNLAFYQQYAEAGITAQEIPIMAVSIDEVHLQRMGNSAVGHYATCTYFQSIDTPVNQRFVQDFQARYGNDRVTSDPIADAYSQVYLWKQAVEAAGSFEVDRVRCAAYGQTFISPGGLVQIEPNHHLQKQWIIGKILPTHQFQILKVSDGLVKPLPWCGVEEANFNRSDLVINLLAEVSQSVQYNCDLAQKSRDLEATNQTLETLRLTQVSMIQAEKMASLSQLVAGIAHEINNPTNFIHGNLFHIKNYIQDLIEIVHLYQQHYSTPVPAIQAKLQQMDLEFLCGDISKLMISMDTGVQRITDIILSLRNFSRKDQATFKAVDIHEGIESTLVILEHRLKAQSNRPAIQVIKKYGTLPRIECFASQLNQVFMNLLMNAIDALEEMVQDKKRFLHLNNPSLNDPHFPLMLIRISTDWDESTQTTTIRIANNGPAIPDEIRSQIFDPFFTTKPIGKGTGLGLSISYQVITEQHKGSLECISSLGQGTEFVIRLPRSPLPTLA